MKESSKIKIRDLITQIEEVDKMIAFNAANPSKVMSGQYEYLKERFLTQLIEEIVHVKDISKYNFQIIYLAISKYYPDISHPFNSNKNIRIGKKIPKEWKDIADALVA